MFVDCAINVVFIVHFLHSSEIQSTLTGLHSQLQRESSSLTLFRLRVVLSNCPRSCLKDPFAAELIITLLRIYDSIQNYDGETSMKDSFNDSRARCEQGSSTKCEETDGISCVLQCLALVANKHEGHSESERGISDALARTHLNASMSERKGNTLMAAYLAKGLLMRGHRLCEEALKIVIQNVPLDINAANSFAIIAQPQPTIFPREGHCTVRLLYTQRLLTFAVPRLLESFERGSDSGEYSLMSIPPLNVII